MGKIKNIINLLKKNNFLLGVYFVIIFFFYIFGINWGIPSKKINMLYFYKKDSLNETLKTIKQFKQEELWKGYGYYLSLHPEFEKEKLPRNLYNSIRSYHPDEYFIIKVISTMNPEKFDFNPHQFGIGGAYIYFIGLIFFLFYKLKFLKLTKNLDFYFLNPDEIGKFYILGRIVNVIYGVGVIILSYLISKKIYKKQINAYIVSFLISFSPLIILNSSYMYVDIPALFWTMFCLYYSLIVLQYPSYKRFFIAGIICGFTFGIKIPFIVLLFIPFLTALLTNKTIKRSISSLICIIAGALISFAITNPYFFIKFPLPLFELKQHTSFSFKWKFYLFALAYGIGPPIFFICLIGFFNKINFIDKKRVLLSGWTIFYFLFISLFTKNYARYILPIVPSFIVIGIGLWLNDIKKLNILKNFIVGICILFSLIYGLSFKGLFIKENNRTEAGIWIKENIPEGKSIGVCEIPWQFQLPPFDYFKYKVTVINYDFEKLKKEKPDYFIFSSFQGKIPPYPWNLQKDRIKFTEEFINSKLYKPIKVFEKPFCLGPIKFKFKTLPEDLIYINPTIIIFQKNV